MIVATACSHTPTLDHEGKEGPFSNSQLAVKWLDWCARLGGISNTELLILGPADFRLPDSADAWKKVTFLRDRVNVKGWPYGPNNAFGQLAWHMNYRRKEPWLFCEPDCIPLHPNWLAELEYAYRNAGKPFMGVRAPAGPNYPEHMPGNAIYPANAAWLAPEMVSEKKMNVAWDIRGARQVMPQMAETNLIFQLYRHPPFQSLEELRTKVPPSAALFHSDKYGRVAELLSAGASAVDADQGVKEQPAPGSSVTGEIAERVPVFSTAQLCEIISANIKSETARTKLMTYLHSKQFHQKNFGAAIKELALNAE